MLERILDYERELFLTLNGSHSVFWDNVMWLYSGKIVWLPLAAFVLIILTYKVPWREWLPVLLAIVLVVTLCDQFASHVCKPFFARFRPTHHPDFEEQVQIVFGYRGGMYGFISSHAANAFGFSMFMALLFQLRPLFCTIIFTWATITAYSRIYLGVHFISDIVPGILAGLVFGSFGYFLYTKVRLWMYKIKGEEPLPCSSVYTLQRQHLISVAIILSILALLIFNTELIRLLR